MNTGQQASVISRRGAARARKVLLPQPQWVVPIFANTLRFGSAVPI